VKSLVIDSDSGCGLRSLLSRMQRLHVLFNEPHRLVTDLRWDWEIHASLAIREEIGNNVRATFGEVAVKEYGQAEWWQDFAYGIQYLVEVKVGGISRPVWLRVVDDRRFQLKVLPWSGRCLAMPLESP